MPVRRATHEVKIGKVGVGGDNPIRIQSMTTSNTRDVGATVEQIIRLADAGCEIARVTVQGMKEAEACEAIKDTLLKKGYEIPLVADIHFYPPAALKVAESADKVRINPGNFVDPRASFKRKEYDDATYALEVAKIEEGLAPLVEKCKKLKKALRIGTNHGSLSDRIMNRFGDTPHGMVESALEFARVCRAQGYHDFLFSMKSSNVLVMVQAYKLLVAEMDKLGWHYPLHLGVTESGAGEEGRIKSASGIGALLLSGIGDTIRVSLTEDPWEEIDPCKRLVRLAEKRAQLQTETETKIAPKRASEKTLVCLQIAESDLLDPDLYAHLGCSLHFDKPEKGIATPDLLLLEKPVETPEAQQRVKALQQCGIEIIDKKSPYHFCAPHGNDRVGEARRFCQTASAPIIFDFSYDCSWEDLIITAAAEFGALFIEGFGDGICLRAPYPLDKLCELSFNILQAVRRRTFKTEFISCPGCGRTLFDLQEVSRRIRAKTEHLPGVRIAIMGCIVNGPGEMADADFGYVGSKVGMVDLYVGKTCVERHIPSIEAEERLIALLKTHGRWIEPQFPLVT